MTRPPSEAVDLTHLIPHSQEHLFHVGEPATAPSTIPMVITTTHRVLFLCTGNYYRSRYTEELFNHLARAEGLAWRAFSCCAAEKGSSDNVGPMSRFAREALEAKGIASEGGLRNPRPCTLADFDEAQLVIALKEAEHRPLIERRFPEAAHRVTYWHVDDIEFAHPSIALAMIDDHVRELMSTLK